MATDGGSANDEIKSTLTNAATLIQASVRNCNAFTSSVAWVGVSVLQHSQDLASSDGGPCSFFTHFCTKRTSFTNRPKHVSSSHLFHASWLASVRKIAGFLLSAVWSLARDERLSSSRGGRKGRKVTELEEAATPQGINLRQSLYVLPSHKPHSEAPWW